MSEHDVVVDVGKSFPGNIDVGAIVKAIQAFVRLEQARRDMEAAYVTLDEIPHLRDRERHNHPIQQAWYRVHSDCCDAEQEFMSAAEEAWPSLLQQLEGLQNYVRVLEAKP